MSALFFLAAIVLFLIDALSPVFEYTLGEFHAIAWGLASLAAGFFVSSAGFTAWRSRV